MAMQFPNPAFAGAVCPSCGCPVGAAMPGFGGAGIQPWFGRSYGPGFGGAGYGMPSLGYYGPYPATFGNIPTDDQIRQMVEESLDADPAIPYDSDINVDVSNGVVTLTGTVPNKRIKHAAGDDAWWIPPVIDVNNELEVSRVRKRAEAEQEPSGRQTGASPR